MGLQKSVEEDEEEEPIESIVETTYSEITEPSLKSIGMTLLERDIKRMEAVMLMLGTSNKSEAIRFMIEGFWSIFGENRNSIAKKDGFTNQMIESIHAISENPNRKKKESFKTIGATVWETDIKRIETVMQVLNTSNKSEIIRFIIEVFWISFGKDVEKKIRNRQEVLKKVTKQKIPDYYKSDLEKILDRVNKKVVGDVVEELRQDDIKKGYPSRVLMLDWAKLLGICYPRNSKNIAVALEIKREIEEEIEREREEKKKLANRKKIITNAKKEDHESHITDALFAPIPDPTLTDPTAPKFLVNKRIKS